MEQQQVSEPPKMSIDIALKNVDMACANFTGNRETHAALLMAMNVIKEALPKEETTEDK